MTEFTSFLKTFWRHFLNLLFSCSNFKQVLLGKQLSSGISFQCVSGLVLLSLGYWVLGSGSPKAKPDTRIPVKLRPFSSVNHHLQHRGREESLSKEVFLAADAGVHSPWDKGRPLCINHSRGNGCGSGQWRGFERTVHHSSGSQPWAWARIPQKDLLNTDHWDPPQNFYLIDQGWVLRICISDILPEAAFWNYTLRIKAVNHIFLFHFSELQTQVTFFSMNAWDVKVYLPLLLTLKNLLPSLLALGLHCCTGFPPRCREQGLLSAGGAQASHCGSSSCCRAQL